MCARRPYYVVTPPYVRTSAGIKALHLLCDALNQRGETAYLVIFPMVMRGELTARGLNTPLLQQSDVDAHINAGLDPITIYSETVTGNPFRAATVVRYVMNFPGLLGGDTHYPADELCFGYSKRLAEATGNPERVLFIPASDPTLFHPPEEGAPRAGACFYAAKYKGVHGGVPTAVTKDAVEITRDLPDSQTPEEIADLFRTSAVFYTYENTSLATEAVMCGCPAVFLPNPFLTEIIGSEELGSAGFAWGATPEALSTARGSVAGFYEHYLSCIDQFWRQLDVFIAISQAHVGASAPRGAMRLPTSMWGGRALSRAAQFGLSAQRRTVEIARNEGIGAVLRRGVRYIGRQMRESGPAPRSRPEWRMPQPSSWR